MLTCPRLLVVLMLPQPSPTVDESDAELAKVVLCPIDLTGERQQPSAVVTFNIFLNGGNDHHLVELSAGGHVLLLNSGDKLLAIQITEKGRSRHAGTFNDRFQVFEPEHAWWSPLAFDEIAACRGCGEDQAGDKDVTGEAGCLRPCCGSCPAVGGHALDVEAFVTSLLATQVTLRPHRHEARGFDFKPPASTF